MNKFLSFFIQTNSIPPREKARREAISNHNKSYFATYGKSRKIKVNGINENYFIHVPIITKKEREQLRNNKGQFTNH